MAPAKKAPTKRAPTKGNSRKKADPLDLTPKQEQALELRTKGYGFHEIAETMGVNRSAAFDFVQAALTKRREETTEKVEHLRTLELERLDHLLKVAEVKAAQGDEKWASVYLRISERRSKILGLEEIRLSVDQRYTEILQIHLEG